MEHHLRDLYLIWMMYIQRTQDTRILYLNRQEHGIICYLTILSQQKDSRAVSDLKKKRFWNTDILLMTQCMHLTEKSRQQRLKRNLEFQRIRKLSFMLQHGEMTSSTKQDSMVLNLILMLTDFRKSLGMNMYCY